MKQKKQKQITITMTILLIVAGMLIGAGGCDKPKTESLEEIKIRVQKPEVWEPIDYTVKAPKLKQRAQVVQQVKICSEHCATIGVFLIHHKSEFGTYTHLKDIKFIGTITPGKVAYDVPLTNGRAIQFWFDGDHIFVVGEEVPGGFIAHYGT